MNIYIYACNIYEQLSRILKDSPVCVLLEQIQYFMYTCILHIAKDCKRYSKMHTSIEYFDTYVFALNLFVKIHSVKKLNCGRLRGKIHKLVRSVIDS